MSVVLRLVLDQHGQMIHGEVVGDATTRAARFNGWRGLTRAVQVGSRAMNRTTPTRRRPHRVYQRLGNFPRSLDIISWMQHLMKPDAANCRTFLVVR